MHQAYYFRQATLAFIAEATALQSEVKHTQLHNLYCTTLLCTLIRWTAQCKGQSTQSATCGQAISIEMCVKYYLSLYQ